MKINLKDSLGFKVFFTGLLATLLMIPLIMVGNLVSEREGRRNEAVKEVSSRWGHPQTLGGPVLVVPYRTVYVDVDGNKKIARTVLENAYFLPETLNVGGKIIPERRNRGLYEVVLYGIRDLVVSGAFARPDFRKLNIPEYDVIWDQAYIAVGIPDTRGIQQGITMKWDGRELSFLPGVKEHGPVRERDPCAGGRPPRTRPRQARLFVHRQPARQLDPQLSPDGKGNLG